MIVSQLSENEFWGNFDKAWVYGLLTITLILAAIKALIELPVIAGLVLKGLEYDSLKVEIDKLESKIDSQTEQKSDD